MSSGVAVITSRTGGLTDFIEDGKTGIFVPPGDHEALASKINELLNDDEYRLRLGVEARKKVLIRYSWSQIVNEYISVIKGL
jgi:glycosyltransferase involved in cell wall biosynthesis